MGLWDLSFASVNHAASQASSELFGICSSGAAVEEREQETSLGVVGQQVMVNPSHPWQVRLLTAPCYFSCLGTGLSMSLCPSVLESKLAFQLHFTVLCIRVGWHGMVDLDAW